MPSITFGYTNSPTNMIVQNAAGMILAEPA